MTRELPGSPLGLHRVIEPAGALPQAAWRLDPSPELWPDETRVRLDRLNLDAASFRQLTDAAGGDPDKLRAAVLGIVAERGKMQNPVTGSGGMLTGVVDEAGPAAPLGLAAGDRVATLVSLSLTPLVITGVGFPTRSIRVQWPQYWGQVGSTSASTLVGYRWVRPSTAHISASCSESLVAYGCEGQSARRSLNTGIMYRRTGSA